MLCVKITFWTLAYILSSDVILRQVKMEVDDVVAVSNKRGKLLKLVFVQ